MIKYIEDCFTIQEVKTKQAGPNYRPPVSGYSRKIPTSKMIKIDNRWFRLYCMIYSNIGSIYIVKNGENYFLRYDESIGK